MSETSWTNQLPRQGQQRLDCGEFSSYRGPALIVAADMDSCAEAHGIDFRSQNARKKISTHNILCNEIVELGGII